MTKLIAIQDGDWSTLATWGKGTNTAVRHASTTLTITTNYTAKFTAPDLVSGCLGAIFQLGTVPSAGYSYTITLQENEVDTAATVTIPGSVLTVLGAVFARFATPYVFTSLTASYYRFKIVRSGSGSTDLKLAADSGGSLVAFQAVDNRTPAAAPTTGDDVWIIGGNNTGTVSVILSGTQYVGSGTDTTPKAYSFDQAVYIGVGGLLSFDTVASATLTCKGWICVQGTSTNKGEFRIGTASVPYPAANKATLIFDNQNSYGKAGIHNGADYSYGNYGRVQLHGAPNPNITNWKTTLVSGTGTVADPIVVADAVDWNTGDEIIVTTTSRTVHEYRRDENELLKITKINPTTYSLVGDLDPKNSDFEGSDFTGWTRSGTTAIEPTIVHSGAKSAKLTGSGSYVCQDFYVMQGAVITLKFWTRGDGTNAGRYQVYRVNSTAADIVATKSTGVSGTTWTEVTETFTVPVGCYQIRLYLHSPSAAGGIAYFDDVTMTYPGLMYTHIANQARVLNITRNVIVKSVGDVDGWEGYSSTATSAFYAKTAGDLDFDWVRFISLRGAICGTYMVNGPYYHAVDYCVFTKLTSNSAGGIFYWTRHSSYAMEKVENYTGNVAFKGNAGGSVFSMLSYNKNLIDCFVIQVNEGSVSSFKTVGEATFTRCCSISQLTGDTTGGFDLAGAGINLIDCEVQSCTKNPIYISSPSSAIITRMQIGNKGANNPYYTWDIASPSFSNLTFRDSIFLYPFPNGSYNSLVSGTPSSEWKIQNYGGAGTNVDIVVKQTGYRVRTGTGLTDTTAHTAGGYAVRFQSTSADRALTWSFDTPTGNIQNKTMTVAVWCKINSANYYSGVYALPKLSVTYDGGTTVVATAAASTDWQLLSVTFTPTTTFGQISVELSTLTDQATSSAYVYFDDFSVLYPAGSQVNLGAMDIWADGNPITPPISTSLSALDVWAASTLANYGTNTTGELVKSYNTLLGLIKAVTDQLRFTVANQVDANALTGGGASAADVRIEMDANSTKLTAINAKTTNLPVDPASERLVEAAIAAIPAGISAEDVMTAIVEGAITLRDSLKLANAMNAGKVAGGNTTSIVIRDLADTLDRIIMTVDIDGNRTAVAKDFS